MAFLGLNDSGQAGSAQVGDSQAGQFTSSFSPFVPPSPVTIDTNSLRVLVLPDLFKWLYGEDLCNGME